MAIDKFDATARFAEQFAEHLKNGADLSMRAAKQMYDFWYAEHHPPGAPKATNSLIVAMRDLIKDFEDTMQPGEALDLGRIVTEAGGDPRNRSHTWHANNLASLNTAFQKQPGGRTQYVRRLTNGGTA